MDEVKLPRRGIITCTVLDSVADGNVMLEELGFLNTNKLSHIVFSIVLFVGLLRLIHY